MRITMERPVKQESRGRLTKDGIRIYETSDFDGMHAAGALAASILDAMSDHVFPGQTTGRIDEIITQMGEDAGAKSATIGAKTSAIATER